jgi:predicted DNA-binding transcriptional regulator AlpA
MTKPQLLSSASALISPLRAPKAPKRVSPIPNGEGPKGTSNGPSDKGTAKDERFFTSKAVRARYGNCSDMWIYRRLHDDSGFPRPIEISGRRFWKLSALIAWERARGMGQA